MNKAIQKAHESVNEAIEQASKSPYRLGYHIMAPAR